MSSATEPESSDSDSPGSIAEFLTGSSSESEGSYSNRSTTTTADSDRESVASSVIKTTSQEDYMSDPVEPLLLESDAEQPPAAVVSEPAKKPAATKKKSNSKKRPLEKPEKPDKPAKAARAAKATKAKPKGPVKKKPKKTVAAAIATTDSSEDIDADVDSEFEEEAEQKAEQAIRDRLREKALEAFKLKHADRLQHGRHVYQRAMTKVSTVYLEHFKWKLFGGRQVGGAINVSTELKFVCDRDIVKELAEPTDKRTYLATYDKTKEGDDIEWPKFGDLVDAILYWKAFMAREKSCTFPEVYVQVKMSLKTIYTHFEADFLHDKTMVSGVQFSQNKTVVKKPNVVASGSNDKQTQDLLAEIARLKALVK